MNTNEYYIETDYADLAGPYESFEIPMMQEVVKDMQRGQIDFKVDEREDGFYVMRKNMILRKPAKK